MISGNGFINKLFGWIGDKYVRLRVDASTHTLQQISYEHHEIHDGRTFRVQANNDSIGGGGGELVIGFYVPDQTRLPHIIWEFVHEGNMTMEVLEGVTITVSTGTDVLCKNSRRDSANTSVVQGTSTGSLVSNYVTSGPTYSGGDIISLKRNYGAKNIGTSGSRRSEIVLKKDTYYAFVLTNNEASTQGGQIRLEWYEHIDKD